jgi:hypothetical protein
MSYIDELSEMQLKDSFILKNEGNAVAEFSIKKVSDNFLI